MKQPAESEVCDGLQILRTLSEAALRTISTSEIDKRLVNEKPSGFRNQPPAATRVTQPMTNNIIALEHEYRSVRQALVRAGLMVGSALAIQNAQNAYADQLNNTAD